MCNFRQCVPPRMLFFPQWIGEVDRKITSGFKYFPGGRMHQLETCNISALADLPIFGQRVIPVSMYVVHRFPTHNNILWKMSFSISTLSE